MEVANTDRKVNAALIGSAGESQAVSVAGTREFIEMLSSNLYSRPQEAIIREILCNSDDAHKDNGYAGPIEVNISENYTLTIRDRGKGIPHELMGQVYGTYGGSTKKKDSMATGGFGLGCKSPWSYCDVFQVVNHHAGKAVIYSMLRVSPDHDGLPAIVPLARYASQETGIEVRLDLKPGDVNNFNQLIHTLTYRGGLNVTLNGTQLPTIEYDPESNYKMTMGRQMPSRIMVKYGAVLYPVERHEIYGSLYDQIIKYMPMRDSLILQAAPDSLIISPNRENVSYLDKTVKTIWELIRAFMAEINDKAEPYAKKLIQEINDKHISYYAMGWMGLEHHKKAWLITPDFGEKFDKMDVFHQVIHSKLAHEYPGHLHKFALEDRIRKTRKLIKKSGRRTMKYFEGFVKAIRAGDTEEGKSMKTRNRFIREYIMRDVVTVARRGGLNLSNLKFGFDTTRYYAGWNKSTATPQSWTDMRNLSGRHLGQQWTEFAGASVVISHTTRGPCDSPNVPANYFLYVVPRKEDAIKHAIAHFKKHHFDVIDITVEQKITSGAKKEKAVAYPTIGALRRYHRTDGSKVPMLNYARDVRTEDLVEEPEFFVKTSIRANATQYEPTDMCGISWKRMVKDLVPDNTAIVTTDADVKRLMKAGARPVIEHIYEKLNEMWADPKVRRLYAYIGYDNTSGYNKYDRSVSDLLRLLGMQWYREKFDITVEVSEPLLEKVKLLSWYERFNYDFHHRNHYGLKDSNNLYRKIRDLQKQKEPKKLTKLFDFLEENPVVTSLGIDLERLINWAQHHSDEAIKSKLSRILSIIME